MSKIEQNISDIEMYLDSCKAQAFSGSKRIVVEKDIIDEMLVELRMQTPEEIKRYQKIIANKDAILSDAKVKANAIIADANRQTEQLLSEHEIMTQAQAQADSMLAQAAGQAQQIVDQAVTEANQIRESAVAYTDEQLATLENMIYNAMSNTEARFNAFMNQMQDVLSVITSNRQQLAYTPAGEQTPVGNNPAEDYYDEALSIDED